MTDLTRLDAGRLQALMERGATSAVEIARAHAERIERLDGRLGAFLRLNPDLERDAARADRLRGNGGAGPLTGIPLALKDNLCTEGLETTCASRILGGFVPLRDATTVERMRRAGAVILGKTNMDEFAMGSSTENSAHGVTRNPWDPERVPGGSSGGSAVAVAAGMAPLALGSDTGGSIRQPAALCGVVGLKPTYGRVSRSGLVAFGSSLDQVGPLSRSVADAAAALQIVAGHDPRDATCDRRPTGDYAASCDAGVHGLRVGLPEEYFDAALDAEIRTAVERAARHLEQAGARLEPVSLPHTRFAVATYYLVATAEASSNLARFDGVRFGHRAGHVDGLRGLYRRSRGEGFGSEVQRRIMLGTYALSAGYHDRFYGKAQGARARIRRDFTRVFDAGVRLLLTPTTPTTAFRLGEKLDHPVDMYLSDVFTATANLAGVPGLVVPLGMSRSGLPIGGQLLAAPFDEEALFRGGAVLEDAFPVKIPGWLSQPSAGDAPRGAPGATPNEP